jgi:hypothetical protein
VKRWIDKLPLPTVKAAFACDQSTAHDPVGSVDATPLENLLVVVNEHIFNEVWMIEQIDRLPCDAKVDDVTVVARGV